MSDLISEIMKIAIEKNHKDKNTIFVNFFGHVKKISIDVHKEGWNAGDSPDVRINAYLNDEKGLQKILEYLKKLED